MANKELSIFREKAIKNVSSPGQLNEYLHVTNPGMWIILSAAIMLLLGMLLWASVGTLETIAEVRVVVESHNAQIVSPGGETLDQGMPLKVNEEMVSIASVTSDDFGRAVGHAEIDLPDGIYDGTVVVGSTRPIDFLLRNG